MAELVREFDWAATPLGPAEAWPVELKTMVSFVLESGFPAAIVWGPQMVTIHNDAFRPILGNKPEALGRSFSEIWAEAWPEIGPIAARAFAGEATFIEDFPLVVDRSGKPELAHFTFCYSPLRLADGTVAGMIDTVVETSAAVRARRDLDVLNVELRHRLKNSLATVQTLVRQTLKEIPQRAAIETLMERIITLAAAHDVLFESWTSTTVAEVAQTTLTSQLALQRIDLDGPQTRLGARAAVALSLVLNELATNAAKYGALSNAEGRVRFSWSVDGAADKLRLHWRESGGPPVQAPTRTSFGSRLIDMGLSPGSEVVRDYAGGGFQAFIDVPVDELMVE
jgi:two-component sensor histidine kinase